MATKKKYYAYSVPGGARGVTDDWKKCEKIVSGVTGARFKAFKDRTAARRWLALGARYESKSTLRRAPKPGIYFDAGTGRGAGVEISVTDEKGKDLLHKALFRKELNRFGKHLLGDPSATNNYGELLALRYSLEIAKKEGIKKIFGDSRLVIDYWSKWRMKRKKLPQRTVELVNEVAKMREAFEEKGGVVQKISGAHNPADLGFHK